MKDCDICQYLRRQTSKHTKAKNEAVNNNDLNGASKAQHILGELAIEKKYHYEAMHPMEIAE